MNVAEPRPARCCLILALAGLLGHPLAAAAPFSYASWGEVLQKFVDEAGLVNYEALAKDRLALDLFLAEVEKTSPRSSPERFPTKNDRLAFWLNAYNATVFKGVLSRGPEKRSVWSGGLLSGTGYKFFVGMDVVVGGERMNLKKLEDVHVRASFRDPRVHAALNCASKGCPRLPREPFDPERLDQQLDAGMAAFVSETRNCTVDVRAGTVTLSKIFDWFSDDFVSYEKEHGNPAGTVVDYVNRYRGDLPLVPRTIRVRFADYDKALNSSTR